MKDRDEMLRSIEADVKKIRYTKRTRLHQEQRFHRAYLHKTPRGPGQTRAYLDGEPPETTNLNEANVKGIDKVAIDITEEREYQDVEQPGDLTGDKATKRLRRHQRIDGHQQKTRRLNDKLDAYREDTDPLSPRKGKLTRLRLMERSRPTQYNPTSPRSSPDDAMPTDEATSRAQTPQSHRRQNPSQNHQPYNKQRYRRTSDPQSPKNP